MSAIPLAIPLDLGVNIDHVATLRQARALAIRSGQGGPAGGSLRRRRHHPASARRPAAYPGSRCRNPAPAFDEAHELEAAITEEMLAFACRIKPHDVCLVPEKRAELTTEGGLDVRGHLGEVTAARPPQGRRQSRLAVHRSRAGAARRRAGRRRPGGRTAHRPLCRCHDGGRAAA